MYSPREDSYILSSVLKEYLMGKRKNIEILDMGSGSGIQAKTCLDLRFKNVLCADIDKEAIKHLRKNKFMAVHSDLFSNIKSKFDLILFNPPYLPEHKYDKEKDTTGGKFGYETILRFLEQAKKHLEKDGRILLLFSSHSKPRFIKKQAKSLGYAYNLLAGKRIFFECLFVYEFYLIN
jgi:release factor glutamine methyltransferase